MDFARSSAPPGGHLKPVCRHWEKKLDGAKNCQEQVIMQSLFTQAECPHSPRPAHSIHTFDRYRGCAAPRYPAEHTGASALSLYGARYARR